MAQRVVVLTLVGLAATMVQIGADIVEGLLAADRPEMSALSADFKDIPGVEIAFYDVVPQFFFLGLVVLAGMLAARRRLPWWSVLLLIGIVLPVATLDLLPLSGLCMLVALAPPCRRSDRTGSVPMPVPAPPQPALGSRYSRCRQSACQRPVWSPTPHHTLRPRVSDSARWSTFDVPVTSPVRCGAWGRIGGVMF
ncbi:hypothetical protein GCM10027614_18770 [Micromonospora vulcania]